MRFLLIVVLLNLLFTLCYLLVVVLLVLTVAFHRYSYGVHRLHHDCGTRFSGVLFFGHVVGGINRATRFVRFKEGAGDG